MCKCEDLKGKHRSFKSEKRKARKQLSLKIWNGSSDAMGVADAKEVFVFLKKGFISSCIIMFSQTAEHLIFVIFSIRLN